MKNIPYICVAGRFCETNIDDCNGDPCDNDGTCKDLVNGYDCDCLPDWTGWNCSLPVQLPSNSTSVYGNYSFYVPDQPSSNVRKYTPFPFQSLIHIPASRPVARAESATNATVKLITYNTEAVNTRLPLPDPTRPQARGSATALSFLTDRLGGQSSSSTAIRT